MTRPVRLRLSLAKGFRLQEASLAANGLPAVKVDRSTALGNPFTSDPSLPRSRSFEVFVFREWTRQLLGVATFGDKEQRAFRAFLVDHVGDEPALMKAKGERLLTALPLAAGYNLACWCPLNAPCHADVLLDLANPPHSPATRGHDMALRAWNIASLCAGVGGLDLGIRIAEPGAHGVVFVEREAAAAAVLVARMEAGDMAPAPIWSDLATFDARPWRGVVDCVTSGDPCQPNSVAGKRGGADDERFLIDQVLRVVDECRPDRVFRENVTGNADGQLAALVPALEGMGYRVAAGIFSAAEVGASHRRERLFVMADRRDARPPCARGRPQSESALVQSGDGGAASMGDPECPERRSIGCPCGDHGQDGDAQRPEGANWAGASGADLADADDARSSKRRNSQERRGAVGHERSAAGAGCGLLFAPGPDDSRWPAIIANRPDFAPAITQPAVRGMDARLASRVDRLRACGNGVTSLAAAYAWRSLAARLAEDAGSGDVAVMAPHSPAAGKAIGRGEMEG